MAHNPDTSTTERQTAAIVSRSNGAYLIQWIGGDTDNRPSNELYEAAPSLAKAKRIAVAASRSMGFTGAVRWTSSGGGSLWLEMTWPADDEGGY